MNRITLFFILVCHIGLAQQSKIESIALQQPIQVKEIVRDTNNIMKVFLKSDFAKQFIIDTSGIEKLKHSTIRQIDLVYSKYKSVETFNQQELNTNRFKQLYEWFPSLFSNSKIKWRLIEQTNGDDAEKASKLFHGFVFWLDRDSIHTGYNSETSYLIEVMKKADISIPLPCAQQVKEMIAKKKLPSPPYLSKTKNALKQYFIDNLTYPEGKIEKTDGYLTFHLQMKEDGSEDTFFLAQSNLKQEYADVVSKTFEEMPAWKPSDTITGKVRYDYTIRVFFHAASRKQSKIIVAGGRPRMVSFCKDDTLPLPSFTDIPLYDSTVLKVFSRNTHWNNMLIVDDCTGSMSPYTAQLLIWYQLMLGENQDKVKYFAFFNDGNNKPDENKVIGMTGGIYSAKANTMTEIQSLVCNAMNKGSGGDIPENNIEALLAAIKAYPGCGDLIMIADNLSTPRDLSLLKSVKCPVKIILCGTEYFGINTAYLDIARQTGGSVSTFERDVVNLSSVEEGQIVTIGHETFKLYKGKFIKANNN